MQRQPKQIIWETMKLGIQLHNVISTNGMIMIQNNKKKNITLEVNSKQYYC